MEPDAKKSKLNEQKTTDELQFSDLNDHCIQHILWKLAPADLCSISFTCRRMKELAFDHFPRQYPHEELAIRLVGNGKASYFTEKTEEHLKYFAKCIQNIRIIAVAPSRKSLQRLFDFVNTECCADLRSLELNLDRRAHLLSQHVEVIKGRLENLLRLSICQPRTELDIHDVVLKHCKKIEHFEIHAVFGCDVKWMMHEYPTMKSLLLDLDLDLLISRSVENLIRLNPQITELESVGSEAVEITRFIWAHATNIQRLTFRTVSSVYLTRLIEHLRDREENRLEWLGLEPDCNCTSEIDYQNVEMLNALQPIRYLQWCLRTQHDDLRLISKLQSIQQLDLVVLDGVDEVLAVLSKQQPNLQDLRLDLVPTDHPKLTFMSVVMQLVQHSLKMRNLIFKLRHNHEDFLFHPDDLVLLNQLRWPISGAVPMTIQLGYRETHERPEFNYTALSIVNLKFVTHRDLKLWKFS